jgi:tetratricopeptide (TPR) repeat protein
MTYPTRLAAFVLGLTVCLGAPLATAPAEAEQSGEEAQREPEYSKAFRKQAGKIQKNVQDQDWDKALEGIDSLMQEEGLTPDDLQVLYSWRLAGLQATGQREAFMAAIEAYLDGGYARPDQIGPMNQQLAAWYNGQKDMEKTLLHYRRFVDATDDLTAQEMDTMGRLYMQAGEDAEGVAWLQRAIETAEAAGETPAEVWFQLLDRSFVDMEEGVRRLANLEALVGYYPKPEYYTRVLALYSQATDDDRMVMLNTYRLALVDSGLETVGQYLSYADHALVLGSPGEAARGLQQGMDAGIVPSEGSNQQTLKDAQAAAAADRKNLPKDAETAAKNAKGEIAVKVGLGFYSIGDWERAVELVKLGLEKGGVQRLDDANLLLGAALVQLGRYDEARDAFEAAAAAAGSGSYMARVAGLWEAYVDRKSGGTAEG